MPDGNDTTDTEINRVSIAENRIVISKNADFYDSFTAQKEPYKLLHVKTGNIKNSKLLELFEKDLELIVNELDEGSVIKISQISLSKFNSRNF